MNFTNRQTKILNYISNSDLPITGKQLSLLFNCSVRTIQNEISNINKNVQLINSSNKGYELNKKKYYLLKDSNSIFNESFELDSILKKILLSNEPIYIYDLADENYISISTLEKKLKQYSSVLAKFELSLLRDKGYISIKGKEINKRIFIKHLIITESNDSFSNSDVFSAYFDNMDIKNIKKLMIKTINNHNYSIDPIYSNTLALSLSISLYRMKIEHYIDKDIINACDNNDIEYQIAIDILTYFSNIWNLKPTKNDINYIASLFIGQIKPIKITNNPSNKIVSPFFILEIEHILNTTFSHFMLKIDFSKSLESFSVHIDGLIKRSKNNQPAYNYAVSELKKDNPFIYEVAVYIANQLSEHFSIKINDSEIGFICIYIGYLVESALKRKKVTINLICNNYHQIKEKLYSKLENAFSDCAIITTDTTQSYQSQNYDLIVTTDIIDNKYIRCIRISPYLNYKDMEKINSEISNIIQRKRSTEIDSLFSKFFSEKLFFIDNRFNDKFEVIKFLSKKIIETGIANTNFTSSVIKRELLSSTAFGNGYAIPHAIDLDAKKTMVSILISNEGISWDENIVYVVFLIAVKREDRKNFVNLYENIIKILEDISNIETLKRCSNYSNFEYFLLNQL